MEKESGSAGAPQRDQPRGGTALLIIDMINRFDFPGADLLRPRAEVAARSVVALAAAARRAGDPVIYVNDNFGEWHSERARIVDSAADTLLHPDLAPDADDYFIIKPQFSGFYATNLPVLLPKLGVNRLVLTGIATDICVLFTAADAHMRDYRLWVPADAVAARGDERDAAALSIMHDATGADIRPSNALAYDEWRTGGDG